MSGTYKSPEANRKIIGTKPPILGSVLVFQGAVLLLRSILLLLLLLLLLLFFNQNDLCVGQKWWFQENLCTGP